MLTARGKYGLKAVLHLAAIPAGETAMSIEIATANNISKKFLDAILTTLKRAGFVRSRRGPGGGYALARDARVLTVGEVVRALDGSIAPIACASRGAFKPCADCHDVEGCAVRITMVKVVDAMRGVLDHLTIAEMLTFGKDREHALIYRNPVIGPGPDPA